MNRLMLLVNTVLLVITWTANGAQGCSCLPQHPQSQFCSADFVFYGKVLREQVKQAPDDPYENEVVRKYTMQILHTMKGISARVDREIVVQSTGNSGMCGMSLQVGQQYVIMENDGMCGMSLQVGQQYVILGYRSGRKKTFGFCDFVKRTSSLSFEETFYLFTTGPYSYSKNCKNGCDDINDSSKGCHFSDSHQHYESSDCLSRSALCRKEKGVCKWYNHEQCPSATTRQTTRTTPVYRPLPIKKS
ncbi:metalloproteinase inhibitor 3-like [Mytilus trossulus]|uniref:metalloproteinase inhibitor 3-like n=1 Tax=Mytilus trossulus TaxID=6551 RepID=UPI0030073143